jgi:hypothetical protein
MALSATPVVRFRLSCLALLVGCVAALGLVPAATARANPSPADAGRQARHATPHRKAPAKKRPVAVKPKLKPKAKVKAPRPIAASPIPTVPTPSPSDASPTSDAVITTSSPTPWTPIAGGGSEMGLPTTPAPETITSPIPVETAPVTTPTEPTPVTSPTESIPAGRIFTGSKISDFALNQSVPGAVSEVPSPTGGGESALQMTVSNSDVYPATPTDNPRAQLLSPNLFHTGDEFWWHSKFFLPANFPSVPGWMAVMEGPYGAPFDGSPPFAIQIHGETMGWQRNSTYGYDVPWEAPILRGKWTEVLVHCGFGPAGFVELWVNGEQINFFSHSPYNPRKEKSTTRVNMATEDASNSGGTNFAVIQSYRQAGILNTATLLQGPMLIGTTRASVE